MNFKLPFVPERSVKPRKKGLTMVMDKGLSIRQAEDMVDSAGNLVDVVKLGFGSSYITNNLKEKIKYYQNNNIKVYLGGTLFESFIARGMFDEYRSLILDLGLDTAEVSDGCMVMPTEDKLNYISELAKDFRVLSEVGSKNESIIISPNTWIKMMNEELAAGSWKVIAEARESGNVGIYKSNGKAHSVLINKIMAKVPQDSILWEAPQKAQQVYFIKLIGAEVNLGNISPAEIIPCETLRLGLRGDTFLDYLPKELQEKYS